MTLWQNIQYKVLRSGSRLNVLIGINVVVFLLINVPAIFEQLIVTGFGHSNIIDYSREYLSLPAYLPKLAAHFWTPITYMFMHDGFFHIFFNMLWLYWFGQIFEDFLGNKRILSLYLFGGLGGAAFFLLAYNLFPAFTQSGLVVGSAVVGASASVMAVIVGTAALVPNYELYLMFLGPVKIKWIAVFYVVFDFLMIAGPNAGGEIAHLGGAFIGFMYIKQLQRGFDWTAGITKLFAPKSKLKVVSKNSAGKPTGTPRQEEIDAILDKISKSGYDSLSKQEKEILFRASNNEG